MLRVDSDAFCAETVLVVVQAMQLQKRILRKGKLDALGMTSSVGERIAYHYHSGRV